MSRESLAPQTHICLIAFVLCCPQANTQAESELRSPPDPAALRELTFTGYKFLSNGTSKNGVALQPHTSTNGDGFQRLPPVEPPVFRYEVSELKKRVQRLEAKLARLGGVATPSLVGPVCRTRVPLDKRELPFAEVPGQDLNSTPLNEPVHSATFWQQATTGLRPIRLVSLEQALWSEDFSIDIGGYVKADLIHDFNAIGDTDVFDPATIPTDGRAGQNTRLHARQTRLNLDYRPDSDCDDLRLFIEGDFFGTGDVLRMRHAFVQVGNVLAGQTWTTFMDESILPRQLDFESPRSILLDRRALFRWTQPVTDTLAAAVALEDPQAMFDVDAAPPGAVEQAAPDLVARVRYEEAWGHLQGAGLVRLLRFREAAGATDDEAGWGFNFTGRVYLHEHDSVLFQVAFGEGYESYRQGSDAAVDAAGRVEVLPVVAWVAGYEIDWTDRLASTFVYSFASGTNAEFQAPTANQFLEYLAANIIFEPRSRVSCGIEYLYGTRTDKGGAKGEAHRVQFSVRYDLP